MVSRRLSLIGTAGRLARRRLVVTSGDALLVDSNGRSFVLVEHGHTVHEWHLADRSYARDIASAQTSVLSLLVGRAVAEGLLDLDTRFDAVLGDD